MDLDLQTPEIPQMTLTDDDIETIKKSISTCSELLYSEVARMANASLEEGTLFNGENLKKNFRDFIKDQNEIMVKKVFHAHEEGLISDAEWQMYMQGICINFAKTIIKQGFKNQTTEIPDFLSASLLAISEKANEYNPYNGRPSSFFQKYILQEIKGAKIDNTPTVYYKSKLAKYNELCQSIGLKDCTECSIVALANLTGDPIKTIINVLSQKDISVCHMSAVSGDNNDWSLDEHYDVKNLNGETSSIFDNPSEVYRKKETADVVKEALSVLSPLQRFILMNTVYSDKPRSNREMISVLRSEEVYDRYKDEYPRTTKIDQRFINCVKQEALRVLRGNKSVLTYCEKLVENAEFEQTDDVKWLAKAVEKDGSIGVVNNTNDDEPSGFKEKTVIYGEDNVEVIVADLEKATGKKKKSIVTAEAETEK